ncbi:hypothetical protein B7494_g5616 [Chlorociboria aeruginascens]|nr:hypothetical protein B7494_g5616 [Chlorociboria aeruginascens]
MKSHALAGFLATVAIVVSGSTFTPARPPAFPLAVKSPYMNTWLEAGSSNNGLLAGAWPRFWAGLQPGAVAGSTGAVTGWAGLIKVDGTLYTWMGAPTVSGSLPPSVTQESAEYTSERTTFIMNVDGLISMNVSFLSPITPNDFERQSIIGTYLNVDIASLDGASHSVQLYADTSAEWVSATHNTDVAQWSYSDQNGIASHQSFRQNQSEFNDDYADDGAHWGYWYWSTASTSTLTYQSGEDVTVRGKFGTNSNLPNTQDTNYRAISDDWPVFGFGQYIHPHLLRCSELIHIANDLGAVTSSVSTLYTINHAQQNAIYFDGADGDVSVPSLWTSYFDSDLAMVEFFYNDWSNNQGQIDQLIAVDSLAAGGQDYLTITSLSARQAFGAVQLTGTTAKQYLFLKEISSDGNIQTVDVLFPAIPIFLYTNPTLVKLLLDPLYENQEAGQFPQTYSIHDLGANYPRAIGHTDGGGEAMPLEECGNMIIATLAYAQRSGDNAYLTQHYPLMKQWTGYLVEEALIPADQLSTDDFQGSLANQTNLALKGIIAIEAMSVIAGITGNTADQTNYHNISTDYVSQWQGFAVNTAADPPHTTLAYNDADSHGLLYNLYSDTLLSLNLVPQSIYDQQSTFYATIFATYGIPLDTRAVQTKSDWEMWTAAIASSSVQQTFIHKLATWIGETSTNRAFTDLYETDTGDFGDGPFIARPVVGGHFALLALKDTPAAKRKRVEREFTA